MEVERGFSKWGRIISEDRAAMSVKTLIARLTLSAGMEMYNNKSRDFHLYFIKVFAEES